MQTARSILFIRKPPLITLVVLGGCLVGFAAELLLGDALGEFLLKFGLVPVALVSYFRGVAGANFLNSVMPFFSSLFLHGGFIHLLWNVLYLWMVGEVVETWLGRTRFLVLFLFGAVAELIVRIGAVEMPSGVASVGISGGIASLLGGYVVVLSRLAEESGHGRWSGLVTYWPLVLGALAWFPLQTLNRYLSLAATCQTVDPPAWLGLLSKVRPLLSGRWVEMTSGEAAALGLLTSFFLGVFLLALSGRRGAATSAEAPAVPREEELSVLGA